LLLQLTDITGLQVLVHTATPSVREGVNAIFSKRVAALAGSESSDFLAEKVTVHVTDSD